MTTSPAQYIYLIIQLLNVIAPSPIQRHVFGKSVVRGLFHLPLKKRDEIRSGKKFKHFTQFHCSVAS